MKLKKIIVVGGCCLLALTGCSGNKNSIEKIENPATPAQMTETITTAEVTSEQVASEVTSKPMSKKRHKKRKKKTENIKKVKTGIDYSNWIGKWYSTPDKSMEYVQIHDVKDVPKYDFPGDFKEIDISIFFYRIAEIPYFPIYVQGGEEKVPFTASADTSTNGIPDQVAGYIEFKEDRIIVTITDSECPALEKGMKMECRYKEES